jgi:translation initiation factor 2 subunit 2
MADELDVEDFSFEKKKKKKKKINLDELLALEPEVTAEVIKEVSVEPSTSASADKSADAVDDTPNFEGKKKKKSKKKTEEVTEETEEAKPEAETTTTSAVDLDLDSDLHLDVKKKKKKKKVDKTQDDDEENLDPETGEVKHEEVVREYTYAELLERVFSMDPDLKDGKKSHFVLKPPSVMRIGTKKTAFANFAEICKLLHRPLDHLQGFLLAELGTSGSIDGSDALVIKGRFQQKMIENVLRGYIREYVTCHTCKSPETILAKENRLFFLQCEVCGSKCSVANIKAGFQAVTGKRSELRNKAETAKA